MVRIINEEKIKAQTQPSAEHNKASGVLLNVIGIIIADNPGSISDLLKAYGIDLLDSPSEQELTRQLLDAISQENEEFNNDLAELIMDCTLENSYDSFDFKSIFKSSGNAQAEDSENQSSGGEGLLGGISKAISGIGNAIGTGRQARDQATSNTLQGIYAYKAQMAANAQSKSKTKMYMMIGFFVILGFALVAIAGYLNKQSQQTLNT